MIELENDEQEILRLAKIVTPSGSDINSIYVLYKKYVNINAPLPSLSGCMTCGNSIVIYWRKLIEWYNQNKNQFNIE